MVNSSNAYERFRTLAWGLLEFEGGYNAAGEYETTLTNLKWATDYFIKCHTAPNEFWGQVADGNVDHAFWGRPEEYPSPRPAWKIDANNPGSDLAGEAAAALAAASIVFRWGGIRIILMYVFIHHSRWFRT